MTRDEIVELLLEIKGDLDEVKELLKIKKGRLKASPPESEDEVFDFFSENGYTREAARSFWSYYSESGWKDSKGKPVLNWKAKARAVWFKKEHEIPKKVDRFY